MRNLVVSALFTASLLQAATGCLIVADDDDDDRGDNGDDGGEDAGILVQIRWDCPPDAEVVAVTASVAGTNDSLPTDTISCNEIGLDLQVRAGRWDIDVLPEGDAATFLGLTQTIEGVDGDLRRINFPFPQDGGFFLLSWTIDGLAASNSCAEGDTIEVTGTWAVDPDLDLSSTFPCEAGEGVVGIEDPEGWPLGEYVLDVALIDADNQRVDVTEPIAGVSIEFADELFDIGTQDLVVP